MSATKGNTALALTRVWHHASAQNRVLGNLASRIAWVLMGKHKPTYDPAVDAGDYVIVSDALQVRLTGKKATDKVYYHHTGFMGGLKKVPITRLRERRPEEIIRKAVSAPEVYKGNVLTTWRETGAKVEQSPSASSVSQTKA
ncbi:ribosomal protein L13 [Cryptococcus tetragattii IND107]|uniref:Ribosomal protein L13 n=1 Tax=Cryptococcus tetragattii IND107 TaxID=1296105 RepID=A0ABR3C018_9TREE